MKDQAAFLNAIKAVPPIVKAHGGRYIVLEDYSMWEIDSIDRIDSLLWLMVDNITVASDSACLYGYCLIDTSDGSTACGRYIGRSY